MPRSNKYIVENIAQLLKAARERKGLSQRALAAKAGIPQSHISKIESGAVDIRVSSLVSLALILELELALIPRQVAPVVKSIIHSATSEKPDSASRPVYSLEGDGDG